MGLFHRKNKKKSIMLDDKYTIRLEFVDQFKPENNTQVAEAIQSASETEKNNGLPALDQTLPFATLKTAEDLFDNLRDVVAETAEPIEFDYLAIWLFDKTKKAKMGKPNSDDGNPHEYITLPGFKLNYDYQNLTKVIFETIFNLPENSDVSYDEKIEICQDLKQAYLESVNVGENEIARLPKKDEIEKGAVTLDVPAYSTSEPPAEAEPKKQYYDAKTHTFSDHPIEDDTPSTTETVAAEPVSTPAPAPIEKPKPAAKPTAPAASTVHETRSAVRAVTDAADDEQKLAREKGHVSAPQFEVAELDPVEPGQHGYVEYQLNQRKKTFNALLQNSAEKINDKNEKAILDLRESYKTKIEKAVANFRKQHKNDAANLHAKIANELYAAQKQKMSEYRKSIKENKDGLTTQEIQNQLTLGKETEAKMDVQILQQPAIDPWNSEKSGIDGNYGYHLAYNSSVNGAFAKVTYTNLKNSYYVDADDNKHQIIKIVRTFSDLTRSTSTASINWTKERASYEGTTSDNAEKTILSINSIPTNGAMFFNASGVTVSDLYYDKDGNRLSVKDGYIVMSSLNNNGKGDVESAKGLSGQTPKTFIGSSVYVQSDGSLQANGDNSYYLHDSTHSEYNNWDNANSDKFYWGAGLLKINNDGANVIRFNVSNALGNNPEDALNSYWFTISTILPTTANPTSSINYHYNVALLIALN